MYYNKYQIVYNGVVLDYSVWSIYCAASEHPIAKVLVGFLSTPYETLLKLLDRQHKILIQISNTFTRIGYE